MFLRHLAPALLLAGSLVAASSTFGAGVARAGDNAVELLARHRVEGDLVGSDEDRFRFEAPAGSALSLKVKARDGLLPALRLTGPGGEADLAGQLRGEGSARLQLRSYPLPTSGTWTLRLDGAGTSGIYLLDFLLAPPRSSDGVAVLDERGLGTWILPAQVAGARLEIDLKSRTADAVQALRARSEFGAALAIDGLRTSSRKLRFALEGGDSLRRAAVWIEGTPGAVLEARVRVRLPRQRRETLSLLGDPAPPATERPRSHPNLGFAAWLQADRVAELRPGRRSGMFSSFDRSGGNDDGFSGRETSWLNYRIDPTAPLGFEVDLLDIAGAGILNRMHFAFLSTGPPPFYDPTSDRYDLRFYFDGSATPTYQIPLRDFVSGAQPAWPFPLAADEFTAVGGPYNNTPLPFRTGLRIAATDVPHFFDFQYLLLPEEELPASYSLTDDPTDVAGLLAEAGSDPKLPLESEEVVLAAVCPAPGNSAEILRLEGPGAVTRIDFRLEVPRPDAYSQLWLEASYDGVGVPQAAAPLGAWVGCDAGPAVVDAVYFRSDREGNGSIYWPMPFASSLVLRLRNTGTIETDRVLFRVVHDDRPFAPDAGYFVAEHRDQLSVPGRDLVFYDRVGRGHLVATTLSGITTVPGLTRAYLEGDERIYLDDSRSPAVHGTGTEEFFGWGWYDSPIERTFSLPQHGCPYRLFDGFSDVTAQYRVLFPDVVHYERRARFALECGPGNLVQTAGIRYRSVVFAYHRDEPGLVLTDVFDPADPTDRVAHGYTAPGGVVTAVVSHGYEGDELARAPVDDRGVEVAGGAVQFELALDPANRGVVLRRRLDQAGRSGQTARVLVDGVAVGLWRTALNNASQRWLDSEFCLPSAATGGKARIQVRLEPLHYPWNEYRYEAWSRVR